MKKLIMTLVGALCSTNIAMANNIPASCITMIKMMKENATEAGDEAAAEMLDASKLCAEWAKLSDEEKAQSQKDCEEMIKMMKQIESM